LIYQQPDGTDFWPTIIATKAAEQRAAAKSLAAVAKMRIWTKPALHFTMR
jgi:hypothetical protein